MEQEQPKKSKKDIFIGTIIGVVLYKVVVDVIWPLISKYF